MPEQEYADLFHIQVLCFSSSFSTLCKESDVQGEVVDAIIVRAPQVLVPASERRYYCSARIALLSKFLIAVQLVSHNVATLQKAGLSTLETTGQGEFR